MIVGAKKGLVFAVGVFFHIGLLHSSYRAECSQAIAIKRPPWNRIYYHGPESSNSWPQYVWILMACIGFPTLGRIEQNHAALEGRQSLRRPFHTMIVRFAIIRLLVLPILKHGLVAALRNKRGYDALHCRSRDWYLHSMQAF